MNRLAVLAVVLPVGAASAADPEVARLKDRVERLEAEVAALRAELAAARGPRPRPLKVTVLPGGWGAAGPDDVAAVCRSAAAELHRHMPDYAAPSVTVRHDPKAGPMAVFGLGAGGEKRVLLATSDTYWGQYAYQFAHEFCHVAAESAPGDRANLWFEEALCEAASLFALKRMAETWKTAPPYPNWKGFAPNLAKYAENAAKDVDPRDGLSLPDWFRRAEPELRANGTLRAKNRVVAVAILRLLEADPGQWNAVVYLNRGDRTRERPFRDHLRDWRARVPAPHKAFVTDVAGLLGVKLD